MMIQHLRRLAHEVVVVPAYTPIKTDLGLPDTDQPIFLGGVSAYLRTSMPRVAHALRGFNGLLDSRMMLRLVSSWGIQTDPQDLGAMTRGVLQGMQGPHAAEISRLMRHLRDNIRPDVVMLTNAMFAPLASVIRLELELPVVVNFQGEDSFIMDLPEPYREQCIELMRLHAVDFAAVICPSQAAVGQASLLLQLENERFHTIAAPINAELYQRPEQVPAEPLTIGYMSVIRPAKGLDLLLRAMPQVGDAITQPLRLLVGGQVLDGRYMREMRQLASQLPGHVQVEFLGEVSLGEKIRLLHSCQVLCLPSRLPEARGLAAMEAMAAGVPVILPNHGSFPELLTTAGGWLFDPGSAASLAKALLRALANPKGLQQAGIYAAMHVRRYHNPINISQELEDLLGMVRKQGVKTKAVPGAI